VGNPGQAAQAHLQHSSAAHRASPAHVVWAGRSCFVYAGQLHSTVTEELTLASMGCKIHIHIFSTFCFSGRAQSEGQGGGRSSWRGGGFFPPLSLQLLPSRTYCQAPLASLKSIFSVWASTGVGWTDITSTSEPDVYVHCLKKKSFNLFVISSI